MRSDIVPGAAFPDYELPDHENVLRRLSALQRDLGPFHGWDKRAATTAAAPANGAGAIG